MKIIRARHVGYTSSGFPTIRQLLPAQCSSDLPEFLSGQHFGYTGSGLPKVRASFACCDAFCSDAEIDGDDCYRQSDCFPPLGITKKVVVYINDILTCISARDIMLIMEYNSVADDWQGSITLRGGTLNFHWKCGAPDPISGEPRFELTWDGCDGHTYLQAASCLDPLIVRYDPLVLPNCCDCATTSPAYPDRIPITEDGPQVSFEVHANCKPWVWARHVGYTASRLPLVARDKPCETDAHPVRECLDMHCGIWGVIENLSGDCTCMEGTFALDALAAFSGPQWKLDPSGGNTPCDTFGVFVVTCQNLGFNSTTHENDMQLTVRVECTFGDGQDQTGTVIIRASQLEDLNTYVDLTYPAPAVISEDPLEYAESCCVPGGGVIRVHLYRDLPLMMRPMARLAAPVAPSDGKAPTPLALPSPTVDQGEREEARRLLGLPRKISRNGTTPERRPCGCGGGTRKVK